MYFDIISAKFFPNFKIKVIFEDGLFGIFEIDINKLEKIFLPLKDKNIFVKGFIKYGAITWNVRDYELDLAPDMMYFKIKNGG